MVICLGDINSIVIDIYVFFFKQKTAYEMRISDWSSDVCSSDLALVLTQIPTVQRFERLKQVSAKNGFKFGLSMEFADQAAYDIYKLGRASCRERVCQYV